MTMMMMMAMINKNYEEIYVVGHGQPKGIWRLGNLASPGKHLLDLDTIIIIGLFTRPLLPEGSSLQVEILFVCLSVRTSLFPSVFFQFL